MVTPRFDEITIDIYDPTRPLVTVQGGGRTVEHELIGRQPDVQTLGPKATQVRIVGECLGEGTAAAIDLLEGEIPYRTHRRSGTATVKDVRTEPLEKRIEGERVYRYEISLVEG